MGTATSLSPEQILAPLRSIVGEEHARVATGTVVAAPTNTEQIAEVLRFATANGLATTPTGGGTKVHWGNPVRTGIELSIQRLSQLREHAWQDMTCTVEAGCTWAAMQAALAQHGQMVALDPLWPERATVGGIIATNDSGALRLKFGGLRDLIIGMTLVLSDGTVARSGGKVVKNVAGYDLHKLLTGSFGTLGVIAEVNFRLHPVEGNVQAWSVTPPDRTSFDATAFAEPLLALMDSQMTPSCVQLRASSRECALDIRIAAVPECFDEYDARIRKLFNGFEVAGSDGAVWRARQQVFDSDSELVLKVSVIPGELCAVISDLQQWGKAEGANLALVGQATGLLTLGISSPPESMLALIKRLRARVEKFDGSVAALRVPDALRGKFDVWGMQSRSLPLMREIKHRFDPGRILNPGRFVGNI